ncbi:MAG: septal ring lytic transglycosylase RlpA family protein [Treponema sp.]|nr:septal ring lytic transglycosylase RlpA family protein [Treponema sp.]
MKRLGPVLALLLLFPAFSFTQTQTGNASYNSSKAGFTISHSSLSFNTRVKVTNLKNRLFEEAVVNARIPISPDRIADISRDLGNALQMPRNGLTLVEIEILPSRTPAENSVPASAPVPAPAPVPASAPASRPVPASVPAPVPVPASAPVPAPVPAPASRPVPVPVPGEKEPELPPPVPAPPPAVRTEIQYVPVPSPCPERPCCLPFLIPILGLLLLIIILIVVVILLVARKPVFWPWYRPIRIRRRYRCGKWGRNFY